MNRLLYSLCILVSCICLISCSQNTAKKPEKTKVKEELDRLKKIPPTPNNFDSLAHAWKLLENVPYLKSDSLLACRVQYEIGRFYAMSGSDSAMTHLEKALELIEPTVGNEEEKILVYNGIGNIWSLGTNVHKANYFYNKGAMLILADSAIKVNPEIQSSVLLSAAQSNEKLFQHDLAYKMNIAALKLVSKSPPGHIIRQRTLVQMIYTLNDQNASVDSIRRYLSDLEILHRSYPDSYDITYLYDCKSVYYEKTGQSDSTLKYLLLKEGLEQKKYLLTPQSGLFLTNLFLTYTNIAGTYTVQNKLELAEKNVTKAKDLLIKNPGKISVDSRIIYQRELAKLYSKQGKNREAINLLLDINKLQQSNYENQSTQAVAEMNTIYQLQAKDRQIETLNRNIELHQIRLHQNRLWLTISVLATVILVLSIGFLMYSYRVRRTAQEKEKVLLQQQLLRTQMEPHFIFNTLSAVQSFVRLDKKDSAVWYLNCFSKLLRSSLALSRENFVHLDDEIEALENYLVLQHMRFESVFSYDINLPEEEDLGAIRIPPMLIQPYVENAIMHGVDLVNGGGHISIRLVTNSDILEVSIEDTGREINMEFKSDHESLSGIVCRERIAMLGKRASIESTRTSTGGTLVFLQIPIAATDES